MYEYGTWKPVEVSLRGGMVWRANQTGVVKYVYMEMSQ
jgi:hypothetical protein